MTLESRKALIDQRFEEQKAQRQNHLDAAQECLTEMNRLQGEYRLLETLAAEELQSANTKPNKKANVIDVVPEKDK
jgi:hypothetical protein